MTQHPETKKVVGRVAVVAAFCVGWLNLTAIPARAQDGAAGVARISFIQGAVQLSAGQGADFQQAVMNMPVIDGSHVQTGGDGQAEIEFGDGSVARLTPNSAIQFDHLGLDQVQLEQLSGLAYYELNVGDGHPPFGVQFGNTNVQPTSNSILRVGMDAGWQVAVVSGSVSLLQNGIPASLVENQTARGNTDNSGAPFGVVQGVDGDSWDNWNQDRDQAIAQEAAEQTPVRNDSANSQSEGWNDLDADGNWYPVEGAGNVWVPAGVGPDWDPYGAGYWGYYPTFGYTWISAYSWGWLPYHCGAWSYYSFGWGWAPGGGCGRVWSPVIVVHAHPPGWTMPIRPVFPGGGIHPLPGQRLVAVDRGPAAKGPWGFQGSAPRPDHMQALSFRGASVMPLARVDARSQGLVAVRGTSPGTRAVLSGVSSFQPQRPGYNSTYARGGNVTRPPQAQSQPEMQRPGVGYPGGYNNQRSNYLQRAPEPTVHYSPPPAPHYQAPPAAAAPHAGPSGGGAHR